MRSLHFLLVGAGALLFLLALLDLFGLVPLSGVAVWRAGVSIILLDLALILLFPQSARAQAGPTE